MRILVVGAGAIGVYYGMRLEEKGNDVKFLVRKKRGKQIEENGLGITSEFGNYFVQKPHIIYDCKHLEDIDVILLTVKGYHLNDIFDQIRPLIRKGTKIIPLLNGIEHIQRLCKEFNEDSVIGGLTYIFATLDHKGHVIHTSHLHDFVFGPLTPSQEEFCTSFEEVAKITKFEVKLTNQIDHELWGKYMFINALSGVTTAGDFTIGAIRSKKESINLFRNVLLEMRNISKTYGVMITEEEIKGALEKLYSLPENATSSMHQDFRKGLPLEVDHLIGGALRLGLKNNVATPYLETLYALIETKNKANVT